MPSAQRCDGFRDNGNMEEAARLETDVLVIGAAGAGMYASAAWNGRIVRVSDFAIADVAVEDGRLQAPSASTRPTEPRRRSRPAD